MTECTVLKLSWNPPAIHRSCQPLLGYSIQYKIYSAYDRTNWKTACKDTRKTMCNIVLDGRNLGIAVIYKVVGLISNKTAVATSSYYRAYPTLSCKFIVDIESLNYFKLKR